MPTMYNTTDGLEAALQKARDLTESRLQLQARQAGKGSAALQSERPEHMEAELINREKEAWAEAVLYCKDSGITSGIVADYLTQMRQADPELFCRITILAGIEDVYLDSKTNENVIEWD